MRAARTRSRGFVVGSLLLSVACLFVTARALTAHDKVKTMCDNTGGAL